MKLTRLVTGQKYMTLKKQNNNTGLPAQRRLSVQLALTGHSFLITHTGSKEVLFFSETFFDQATTPEGLLTLLTKEINNTPALQDNFDEIVLIHCNDMVTTVPKSLFDQKKAAEYLKFNAKILATDYIAFDEVNTQDIITVYAPYINVNNFFFDSYGSFSYFHATTKLLDIVLNTPNTGIAPEVAVHVFKDSFTCMVRKNNQLHLCNTYSYKTPEDFIYYILFCYEQLGLQTETDSLNLSGAIEKEDSLYTALFTYIRHITFNENTKGIQIKDTPKHQHLIISNL
jgi:hypothetical protein